jgi:hypothetical protein
MADLEKLEAKYREAQENFSSSGSDADKKAYKKAKQAFSDARQAQRLKEENDPEHPRGTTLASVIDEES